MILYNEITKRLKSGAMGVKFKRNKIIRHIGCYKTIEEAITARDAAIAEPELVVAVETTSEDDPVDTLSHRHRDLP